MKFYIFASREHEPDYVSAKVMKKTNCEWSHCGIIVENFEGDEGDIYDATAKGVLKRDLSDFLVDHTLIHKIDITDYMLSFQFALGWIKCSIGKSYSKKMYVGFLFNWLKPFVRDGFTEVVCSEYAGRFVDSCTILSCFENADFDFLDQKSMIETLLKHLVDINKLPEGTKK